MFVYIVRPSGASFFKFGITGDWTQRFRIYQSCFARFDHHAVYREEARALENRIQSAMKSAGSLLPHSSGRDSEVALVGAGESSYREAVDMLMFERPTPTTADAPLAGGAGGGGGQEEPELEPEQRLAWIGRRRRSALERRANKEKEKDRKPYSRTCKACGMAFANKYAKYNHKRRGHCSGVVKNRACDE